VNKDFHIRVSFTYMAYTPSSSHNILKSIIVKLIASNKSL